MWHSMMVNTLDQTSTMFKQNDRQNEYFLLSASSKDLLISPNFFSFVV